MLQLTPRLQRKVNCTHHTRGRHVDDLSEVDNRPYQSTSAGGHSCGFWSLDVMGESLFIFSWCTMLVTTFIKFSQFSRRSKQTTK